MKRKIKLILFSVLERESEKLLFELGSYIKKKLEGNFEVEGAPTAHDKAQCVRFCVTIVFSVVFIILRGHNYETVHGYCYSLTCRTFDNITGTTIVSIHIYKPKQWLGKCPAKTNQPGEICPKFGR